MTQSTDCAQCADQRQHIEELTWYVAELGWAFRRFFAAQAVQQLAPVITAKLEQEIFDKLGQGLGS